MNLRDHPMDEMTLYHQLAEESYRIRTEIAEMLSAIPPSLPNHYDAIVRYLSIIGDWSVPDITRHAEEIIQRRQS